MHTYRFEIMIFDDYKVKHTEVVYVEASGKSEALSKALKSVPSAYKDNFKQIQKMEIVA